MFTPEQKVKRLLDSLAYYLLLGHTKDIETEYRKRMHAKREIPFSSCPGYISDIAYASGSTLADRRSDETLAFETMLSMLDEANEQREQQPKPKTPKRERRLQKVMRLGIRNGEWCRVDTDGVFLYRGDLYRISDQAVQYAPKNTEYGELYDMDRILISDGKFYDMNLDEVEVFRLGREA